MNDVKYPELPKPARARGQQMSYDGWDKAHFDCYDPVQMKEYADATCALRGAQKESGWRPIEESPDELGRRVLVLKDCGPGSLTSISVGYRLGDERWWFSDGTHSFDEWGYRAIAWMPLPSAPTPEGEAK